jgi:uncharacterized membrane protein HdeD (DUF308 family)
MGGDTGNWKQEPDQPSQPAVEHPDNANCIDLELWITLARSTFAIALGILLVLFRDGPDHILANFIGGFWIGVGVLSIRWGLADNRSRSLTIATGMAAILAGALTYGRGILSHWIPENTVMGLLGLVAILTGVLHLTGQITASRVHDRNTRRTRGLLGTFEIGLGVVILLQGRGPLMYDVMAAWALIGGLILLGDALYMHRRDGLARA